MTNNITKEFLLSITLIIAASLSAAYAAEPPGLSAELSRGSQESTHAQPDGMVFLKGGCFQMGDQFGEGSADEGPLHEVCPGSFYLGKNEVTVGEFRDFIQDTGYTTDAEKGAGCSYLKDDEWRQDIGMHWDNPGFPQQDISPVVCVSWNDALVFTRWKSMTDGKTYRLPTEAEWEYAARSGGRKYRYSWGKGSPSANIADMTAKASFPDWRVWEAYNDGFLYTSPVGSFAPNEAGLHDMTGNVWEWTSDWYSGRYTSGKSKLLNPDLKEKGSRRVLRGGSWVDMPMHLRTSFRSAFSPSSRYSFAGFRLARSAEDKNTAGVVPAEKPLQKSPASETIAEMPEAESHPPIDVDTDIPVTGIKNPDAIAVIIGNMDYTDADIPSVDFARNDAAMVRRYMVNVLGYREGNIIYLSDTTKAGFEALFGTTDNHRGRLYNYLKKGASDIFIYYSGHGAPDPASGQGYFVPSDADVQFVGLTGYPLQLLYDNLAKITDEMQTPNLIMVIDACFSGATEKGLLLKNVSPVSVNVKNPLLTIPNAVVLTSSSGSEVSSWYPEKRHGMFTYFFLKALKEMAESREMSEVTAGELFSIISDETDGLRYYARRFYGRMQTPQLLGNAGTLILKGRASLRDEE